MIVKVQRPMAPTDGDWLVYDETRKHQWSIAANQVTSAAKRKMGRRIKAYFEAETSDDGKDVLLIAPVEEQGW